MARRELLQLAKTYKPDNLRIKVAGWLISEKLDGTRCLWDGGITRDLRTKVVPYASLTNPKTGEPKGKVKPRATGLWSRYGNPIMAPDWFLDSLPETPLDGELWAGRGKFQLCRSICAGDNPDPRFDQIQYACYSAPPTGRLWAIGEIKNSNMHCVLGGQVLDWCETRQGPDFNCLTDESTFRFEYDWLRTCLNDCEYAYAHEQVSLPNDEEAAREAIEAFLGAVLDKGGEGVVIRDPNACWTPRRVNALLKYKPYQDCEVIVTGFTSGRKTDKGSKHLGRLGALITNYAGKRLEVSGFTDEERLFLTDEMSAYARTHPGQDMPEYFQGRHFKVEDQISIRYREVSDANIPKEGRYLRHRPVE